MPRLEIGDEQPWKGGYKRWDGERWTYYIRKRDPRLGKTVHGRSKQAEVCTGTHTESVADKHLEEFEKNPLAYDPDRVMVGRAPLYLTPQLCVEFLDYLAKPEPHGKGDTPGHCASIRCTLRWWLKALGRVNLRALAVDEIREQVPVSDQFDESGKLVRKAPSGRKIKIVAIKHLVSWLRKVRGDGIRQGEGPDMTFLSVPQHKGRKLHDPELALARANKGRNALEGYPKLREVLCIHKKWHWAMHALDLQYDTGWHTSEVERWVKLGGLTKPMPKGREHEAAGLLLTVQKNGDWFPTPVSSAGMDAALKLYQWAFARKGKRHNGWDPVSKTTKEFDSKQFPRQQYERLVLRLCEKHGIESFGPGHMRHAVATMNADEGYANSIIGEFLSHTGEGALVGTTYADASAQHKVIKAKVKAVPPRIASPLERMLAEEKEAMLKRQEEQAETDAAA